jgi:DNA polymerase elongation subunit (family B)
MTIQTATGWLLDVSHDPNTGFINLFIKLQDERVISFKQKLKEYSFYILPKTTPDGEDLFQQLSRNDQIFKKIFWANKYVDLADRNKTRLIGIDVANMRSHDYQLFIKKLAVDSRVSYLYDTELSVIQQFIYNRLKIAPTSKVRVKYEQEQLLSIYKVDDSQEIDPPPFKIMHIRIGDDSKNDGIIFNVRLENEMSVIFNGLSYESFISCIKENEPDVAIIYEDSQYDHDIVSSIDNIITKYCNQTVVIHSLDTVDDVSIVEIVEKARFSYLPMRLVSKYRMLRLIDSRITYELLQRDFVVPKRQSISKHHEPIRTLDDITEMDRAGMIISPQIGLHENVAVLDFNDEYANIIIGHNISYENLSSENVKSNSIVDNQTALLPSIVQELVERRVNLRQFLKTQQPDSLPYANCEACIDVLKQILVCLYGTSGSIWNRYSNVQVFEKINKLSRQILLKTKDIVQNAGFELVYADTDAVFLKKKDAAREDFEKIKNVIAKETDLDLTLEFYYKYLVLLYIEADEKMEAKKHYFGLTYDSQLITRGIDTRRHDSPTFIKEFQMTLLSKLFECNTTEEVLTTGYQNALEYITQNIDKLMNGEVQITDLVVSKLLRQNIEKYRSLFPHVAAAIRLNVSGEVANRGDNIQYVHTDSNHTNPLYRVTPAKLMTSKVYDKEKYLELLLDSAEAVLPIFGFQRSLFGFEKKYKHWWNEIYQQRERDIETARTEL